MLKKSYYKGGAKCRVWFYLPADVEAETAFLVGDFNWMVNAGKMIGRQISTNRMIWERRILLSRFERYPLKEI